MTFEEINSLLEYNEKYETCLFMPNEIFDDLKSKIKNSPHIAFSYTYIYLCTWLFRYVKHFNIKQIIDNAKTKEILGYDQNNRTLNYLIKKGGLLDEIEYLETTRDFPISWSLSDEKELEFLMSSELDSEDIKNSFPIVPKRFFLKRPLKGFYRIETDGNEEELEILGTFDDISNTHNIFFEIFLYCMSKEDIGCTGFYLYAYLKHKNDLFESGYDVSLDNLSNETGITRRSINKYLGVLKGYKMIDFRHNQEFFVIGMAEGDRKSNTYITREYDFFNEKPVPYKRIEVKTNEQYMKFLEEREEMVNLVENQVPF